MTSKPHRVLLVDDHLTVRVGYRRMLEEHGGFDVAWEAGNGSEAYFFYRKHQPDVVIMDVTLPDISGIEITRKIFNRYPDARILISSMHMELVFVQLAIKVGALGYITKVGTPELFIEALEQVANGQLYIAPELAQRIAENNLKGEDDPFGRLSPREFEILRMVLAGRNTAYIAEALHISAKTVSNACTSLRNKLDVNSSMELFRLAMRHGMLET